MALHHLVELRPLVLQEFGGGVELLFGRENQIRAIGTFEGQGVQYNRSIRALPS